MVSTLIVAALISSNSTAFDTMVSPFFSFALVLIPTMFGAFTANSSMSALNSGSMALVVLYAETPETMARYNPGFTQSAEKYMAEEQQNTHFNNRGTWGG